MCKKDYCSNQIGIVIGGHIIVNKSIILDRNT